MQSRPGKYGLVVDGLFGIGLARPVQGAWADLVARINAFPGRCWRSTFPAASMATPGACWACQCAPRIP
jgi:NAD(P)H-hydrate repair Nnr-like enzyme with NAD(P)H-hydrate epimerase domain